MKTTSMGPDGRRRIDRRIIGLSVLLCCVAVGCTARSDDRSGGCHAAPQDILRAAASDPRLSDYGAEGWATPGALVLWDRGSAELPPCASRSDQFRFVRSSSGFDRSHPFIAIEKLYFDDDAAFIELGFPPTGKNADVFMRKEAGTWRVKQTHLWEN